MHHIHGVSLDGKLNFDHHVSALCLRAFFKIRALSRIGRFISEDCWMKLYDSFILPNFLYCSIVWHFGSKSSALKVEKVNKRALWVVLNDYVSSYPELLLKTGRASIYVSRIKTIATEMYKCKNYINPAFVGESFTSHDLHILQKTVKNLNNPLLTHWGWDQIDAMSQTTFSNEFSWMKMYEYRLKFHWSLFLRVQLTISQHWFR